MIYQKVYPGSAAGKRYYQCFEYMFVFSLESPITFNPILDRRNIESGRTRSHNQSMMRQGDTWNRNVHRQTTVAEYGKRWNVWKYIVSYGSLAPDDSNAHDHPAIFPLQLAQDHITTWTNPGDVVLDPMAGSGTTLRAAKNLGRKAIGVEIHEDYLPIITERMAQSVMALA